MNTSYTISHAAYTGSTDSDGYPTADSYATPVDRQVFGWYPGSSQLDDSSDYTRRIVQSVVVMAPDTSPYSPRDKIALSVGDEWFVTDVNDYTTGPFGYRPGGTITIEQVSG